MQRKFVSKRVVELNGEDVYYVNFREDNKWFNSRMNDDVELDKLQNIIELNINELMPIPKDDMKIFGEFKQISDEYYTKFFDVSLLGYMDKPRTVFESEIEVYEKIAKAPHNNICKYFGCVTGVQEYMHNMLIGIVLEKCDYTLEEAIKNNIKIDKQKIMIEIKSAVCHLHSMGLVHGDINPKNIMLRNTGEAVLIDFDSANAESSKAGTDGWMSKEYTKSTYDDLYSIEKIQQYLQINNV